MRASTGRLSFCLLAVCAFVGTPRLAQGTPHTRPTPNAVASPVAVPIPVATVVPRWSRVLEGTAASINVNEGFYGKNTGYVFGGTFIMARGARDTANWFAGLGFEGGRTRTPGPVQHSDFSNPKGVDSRRGIYYQTKTSIITYHRYFLTPHGRWLSNPILGFLRLGGTVRPRIGSVVNDVFKGWNACLGVEAAPTLVVQILPRLDLTMMVGVGLGLGIGQRRVGTGYLYVETIQFARGGLSYWL